MLQSKCQQYDNFSPAVATSCSLYSLTRSVTESSSCPVQIVSCMSQALWEELQQGQGDKSFYVDIFFSSIGASCKCACRQTYFRIEFLFFSAANSINDKSTKQFRLRRSFVGNDCCWRTRTCCHSEVACLIIIITSITGVIFIVIIIIPTIFIIIVCQVSCIMARAELVSPRAKFLSLSSKVQSLSVH